MKRLLKRLFKRMLVAAVATGVLLTALPAHAQQKKMLSPLFVGAGVASLIGGVILAAPRGTDYSVTGTPYCVDTYSIDYGSCSAIAPRFGYFLKAAGGGMLAIGMIRVDVKPSLRHSKGFTASANPSWK